MSQAGSFNGNDFQPNINQQPERGDFLQLGRFWHTRERLCMNQDLCQLSMRCMLLGYSFDPWPNSRAPLV